ncbi:MAG: prepilin-type N-terminal cleavage/methylation domain-containing protein [Stenotrophomonas sp.]|uniref:prepilin-type N-terminal cleavage/methylation domain-containing protein n=1 Tax=Stenotrophomonas sp. TaxID=69392 RepID=UPI003D6D7A8A
MSRRIEAGFTLIELMIVVAVIALLAAVAFPAYREYMIKSAETACQAEMRSYAGFALAKIYDDKTPGPSPKQACATADDAVDSITDITGTPKAPGVKATVCSMSNASCRLDP